LSFCRVPKIVNITVSNNTLFPATNTDGESLGTNVQEELCGPKRKAEYEDDGEKT